MLSPFFINTETRNGYRTMAGMNDINALLAALKAKEGGGGMSAEPDTSDEMTAPEDEGSDQDMEEDNGKIVAVLQSDYPQIYAKISKQIEAEDGASTDASDPMADMGMMK